MTDDRVMIISGVCPGDGKTYSASVVLLAGQGSENLAFKSTLLAVQKQGLEYITVREDLRPSAQAIYLARRDKLVDELRREVNRLSKNLWLREKHVYKSEWEPPYPSVLGP